MLDAATIWIQDALIWFRNHKSHLQGVQALVASIQGTATVIALVLGAVWGYRAFVRDRLRYPRLDLSLEVLHRLLDPPGVILLHVRVSLQNHGPVLARMKDCIVRVQHVLPLAEQIPELEPIHRREIGQEFVKAIESHGTSVRWPTIAEVKKKWHRKGDNILA